MTFGFQQLQRMNRGKKSKIVMMDLEKKQQLTQHPFKLFETPVVKPVKPLVQRSAQVRYVKKRLDFSQERQVKRSNQRAKSVDINDQ